MTMLASLAVLVLLAPLHATPFARDLGEAQAILALEDGTVLVSRPSMFDVLALRDRDGDGQADEIRTAVSSIEGAHGLAMRGRTLFVAGTKQLVAADRLPDGSFSATREVVSDLPDAGSNARRMLSVGPDGKVYLGVREHGTLLQLDANGAGRRIHARGLRDLRGLAWHPQTGELWATDGAELNRIGDGLNYEHEPPAAKKAPSALSFDETGTIAYGVSGDSVVQIRFEDGKPGAMETIANLEGAALTGFSLGVARASGLPHVPGPAQAGGPHHTMFVSDERGSIYRLTSIPMSMTSSGAAEPTRAILAKVFETHDLTGAESVLHDEEEDVYLVSGKGFVARVSPDGRVLDRDFIKDLKNPTGMALNGVDLWIADETLVRVVDRVIGQLIRTIDLAPHGAVALTDITAGMDDAMYVTTATCASRPVASAFVKDTAASSASSRTATLKCPFMAKSCTPPPASPGTARASSSRRVTATRSWPGSPAIT